MIVRPVVAADRDGTINADVKQLMLDHAFFLADPVVFWIGVSNLCSRRATEKIGGVLREGSCFRSAADTEPHVIYEVRRKSRVM